MTPEQSIPNVLLKFAQSLGVALRANRLDIPAALGNGYCAGYVFNENIRLLISDYELKADIIVEQPKNLLQENCSSLNFKMFFRK
jgi:hypothetical protein